MIHILTLRNIKKSFSKNKEDYILKNISYTFTTEKIYCILGNNGVGKTTLLNILGSLILPTDGNIYLNNNDINENLNLRSDIFLVPVNPFFYGKLNAQENLKAICSLYKVNISQNEMLNVCYSVGLEEKDLSIMVENFSSGMKQKLNFALMLILSPPVILLDEPFNALDYKSQRLFSSFLKTLSSNGHIIIFTSHLIDTVLDLADEILFLDNAVITKSQSTVDMKEKDLKNIFLS